eukprot:CAMPEP_0182499262 /NCGR_PEP_ID=MMETSP1321-20130603/7405_1 /TAXON_ID=91990 /ORGANISM="Bolidomonas sp., Strain RCC1657" /LENGTH=31 /DNA_ID= /DNA_START= /DNA_END= /DNA_ORIENTATION=
MADILLILLLLFSFSKAPPDDLWGESAKLPP